MKHKALTLLIAVVLCISCFALPAAASGFEVDISQTSSDTTTSADMEKNTDSPAAPTGELPLVTESAEEDMRQHPSGVETPATHELETKEQYPVDIRYESLGSKRYIYKTYKLPEGTSAQSVVLPPYQDDGYYWKNTEVILKETMINSDSKSVVETVETVSDTDNKKEVLTLLEQTMEYDKNGYSGTLELDTDSLDITAGGVATYQYSVSEVREYPGLSSNDMAQVPKTIAIKGGSYSLQTVNWKTTSTTASSGYSDYPTGYTAIATYTGTATGSRTADYKVTASYLGTITKPALNTNMYTIVYEGSIIPPIPVPSPPYLLMVFGVFFLIALVIVFFTLKSNTKVYILEHGVPKLHHKTRITPSNPVVNIEGLEECRLRIVLTKGIVNKLPERKIYLESDRNNYAVKLGNKLVVQYPPFEKPVLEVSASSPYRYTQSDTTSYPQRTPSFSETGIALTPDDALSEEERSPLREMLPNIWQEELAENLPRNAFTTSDLNEEELESNEQVFRVYWKGEKENETKDE